MKSLIKIDRCYSEKICGRRGKSSCVKRSGENSYQSMTVIKDYSIFCGSYLPVNGCWIPVKLPVDSYL